MPALAGLAVALLSLTAPYTVAFAPVDPPAAELSVEVTAATGSGCSMETVDVRMAEDNSALIVDFSGYRAVFGVGAARVSETHRSCMLGVMLSGVAGYTLAVDRVDLSGDAHIERGATAHISTKMYRSGAAYNWSDTLPGPFEGAWHIGGEVPPGTLDWRTCGGASAVNLNTALRIAGGTSNGETTTSWISLRPSDGSVSARYHFTWRLC